MTFINPSSGTELGGTSVTLVGDNFQSGLTVTFGDSSATDIVVVSSTIITAKTSSYPAGTVDVIVTNPNGLSDTLSHSFEFIGIPPVMTSIDPNTGTQLGGTSVTIVGSSFQSGLTVTFGDSTATDMFVESSDTITAASPAYPAGTVDVIVTNPNGLSDTLSSGFTFVSVPDIVGDFDGDKEVGLSDFVLFLDVFGATTTPANSIFDLNGNGEIGLSDFVIFLDNFGSSG